MSETGLEVADVLNSPALQLTLLAGEAGLHRAVSWAHVSELVDPTPWLLGAELIMTTGMAVPRSARAQVGYVRRLDDAGVAALAVSAQLHAPPPYGAMLAAADACGLPLLEVPLSVPFVVIAQEVAAATQGNDGERIGAQLQVFGALRWMTEDNLDTGELFARLEKLSGYTLYLCTAQRRPLLPGVPVPGADTVLPDPGVQVPPSVSGGFVLPVPAPGGTAGFLIARERGGARPGGLAVVQHIATVAALQLTMLRNERETLRREGAETLAELLGGVLDPATISRRLTRTGFRSSARLRLAIATVADGPLDESSLVRDLEDAGVAHLVLRRQHEVALLCPTGRTSLAVLDAQPHLTIGSSSAFALGTSLEVPRREARWALSRALDTGRAHVNYRADEPSGRWLPQDVAGLRALVDRVLGAAVDYDRSHGTDLVNTARTWLDRDRRNDETAAALHVHTNTLAYRLRRFGEITGFSLDSTAALAEVWLAIRASEHIRDDPP